MKTWNFENLTIYNKDFLTSFLKADFVDLIVTSPPYNVGINYNQYQDSSSYQDYLNFSQKWLKQAFKVLKDDGRLCLNIPLDKNKGGNKSIGADLTVMAKKLGFNYHSTIIWNEGNISRRTAWGSWLSASAPYVIAPVEIIVVFFKKTWKKQKKGSSDINKKEFMDWTNGLWTFNGESKKRIGHPAPFPLELPKRCIKLFSYVNDVVLDPFLGSGTTLIACRQNNRRGIGVDIDAEYCKLAIKRINKECNLKQLILDSKIF
jgi:site-specific DNA-methyltransferase (adenine-specific)